MESDGALLCWCYSLEVGSQWCWFFTKEVTVGESNNDLVWFDGASLMLSWIHYTYSRHLLERRRSEIGDLLRVG